MQSKRKRNHLRGRKYSIGKLCGLTKVRPLWIAWKRLFLRETTEAVRYREGSRAARNSASKEVTSPVTRTTPSRTPYRSRRHFHANALNAASHSLRRSGFSPQTQAFAGALLQASYRLLRFLHAAHLKSPLHSLRAQTRLFLHETTEAIIFAEGSRVARNNASAYAFSAKSHACSACSLASALATAPLRELRNKAL